MISSTQRPHVPRWKPAVKRRAKALLRLYKYLPSHLSMYNRDPGLLVQLSAWRFTQTCAQSTPTGPRQASPPGSPSYLNRSVRAGVCQLEEIWTVHDLHLALLHGVDKLELILGNLHDLLEQAGAELGLELLDPAKEYLSVFFSHVPSPLNPLPPKSRQPPNTQKESITHWSAVNCGSGVQSIVLGCSSDFASR